MKTEHELAQVLRWIADGETVEILDGANGWCVGSPRALLSLMANGYLNKSHQFRLKPRTITVNGREVQAGETTIKPETEFFYPSPSGECLYGSTVWCGTRGDHVRLSRGLVHLTKEAAIAHAKAMLNID